MDVLAKNFDKAYPALKSKRFDGGCSIVEPKNYGTAKFQKVTLTGIAGYAFPHEFMGKASSFADIANHTGVLTLDCDGVVLFEYDGQKYILLCELKSGYICDDIVHAKNQIIGSSVKMHGLLNTLQGFDRSDFKTVGLIVSFEPTEEQKTNLSKNEDRKSVFATRLQADRKYQMPAGKTNSFFHPLNVGDLDLFYLPVPDRNTTYTVDIRSILGL